MLIDPYENVELASAIGRVAQASARLDESLRDMIADLGGLGDVSWFLVYGPPTVWLIETLTRVLGERGQFTPDRTAIIGETGRLQTLRNTVIHGLWQTGRLLEPKDLKPRPWADKSSDYAYSCLTTRRTTTVFHEHLYTVGDVEELAKRIEANRRAALKSVLRNEG